MIHDVALQNLPVVYALDLAGIVGADGATHAGAYDIAYIRCVPQMSLLAPSDEDECRCALTTAFRQNHPVAVRYPRGAGVGATIRPMLADWAWGKGVVRREGERIAILAFGTLLHPALEAAQRLGATVVDMRFIKPLDVALVEALARTHEAFVTVEEGCLPGGAGAGVMEALQAAGLTHPVLSLGLPDEFTEHGDPVKLLAKLGLDAAGIEQSIVQRFGRAPTRLAPVVAAAGA
jgi:1-deoxy-D-xylulose-5-phosphate synthase